MNTDFLQKYSGKRVCVALSGGADSVCLAQIFYENAAQYDITLSAVTCEHGIRGAASLHDLEFVKSFCAERNIPLKVYRADIPSLAKSTGRGLEEAGRAFRYECFYKILNNDEADFVATAHHKGDLAETVLFRLARGTSLAGIASIKEQNGIIRPLLHVTKEEILQYIEVHKLAYVMDETNADESYSRNAIRQSVLPALEKIVKGAGEHIADFARRAGEDDAYLQAQALAAVREGDGEFFVPVTLESPLFLRAAVSAITRFQKWDYSEKLLREIEKLKTLQSGKQVQLCGVHAMREGEEIVFYQPANRITAEAPFAEGIFEVGAHRIEISKTERAGALYADFDKFPEGCVIRTRREGDKFTPFGGREKPLKKFLTDKKISARRGARLLLVAKGSVVYAVLGVEISNCVKVTDKTKHRIFLTVQNCAQNDKKR